MGKRVYISGPIEGQPNYVERFAKVEEELYAAGFEICNPVAIYSELQPGTQKKDLIAAGLKMLSDCDAIYMLDGWEGSEISRSEFAFAADHKKTISFEV